MDKIRVKKVIDLIKPCTKLLDIGCWDGYIMQQIIKLGKAKQTVGADNSKSAINLCQKKNLEAIWIKTADEKLPFKNNEFDTVLAGEIIEHLYDVNTFLREVHRILKPKGQFLLTTPNLASIGARLTLLIGKIPWMMENELTPSSAGHIRYFTFDTLNKLLKKYGFITEKKAIDVINFGSRFFVDIDFLNKTFLSFGREIIIRARKK